jgi:hypothetical protein
MEIDKDRYIGCVVEIALKVHLYLCHIIGLRLGQHRVEAEGESFDGLYLSGLDHRNGIFDYAAKFPIWLRDCVSFTVEKQYRNLVNGYSLYQ